MQKSINKKNDRQGFAPPASRLKVPGSATHENIKLSCSRFSQVDFVQGDLFLYARLQLDAFGFDEAGAWL